jgi:hypothetical protein
MFNPLKCEKREAEEKNGGLVRGPIFVRVITVFYQQSLLVLLVK